MTRNLPAFLEVASFLAGELKKVGIEVAVKPIDSAQWESIKVRGEFQLGVDRTGMEPDDPDVTFYEQAPDAGADDPAQARCGLGAAGAGLAPGLLRAVAVREEPDAAPLHLRLGPAAGRLARSLSAVHGPA